MNIELKDKNGITLKTAGKYCSSDVGVIPKLQSKSVATNGSVVADEGYCGLDSVTVAVPATPTQEKTVDLAMASGNQIISPDAGKNLSKVTVTKPSTLVAGNIKTGVSIGGVTGTLEAKKEEETKTVDLAIASGNQTITPTSGKVLSQVVVKKPATMLPENIKKNVNIGGVTGTLEPQTAPTLQTKTVTPTKSQQNIAADSGYDGLSGVTVNAIPDNYVIPTGTVNITANGTHDVSGKASVNVNVPGKEEQTKSVTITANGTVKITPDAGKTLSEVTVITAVESEKPTLNAPTISLSNSTLTITNPATNGNFVTSYRIFNGSAELSVVTSTTVDLSTLLTDSGTYSITVKASAPNFNNSAASSAVSYEVAAAGYNVTVSGDGSNHGFDIYDGQSASGTKLGTINNSESINVVCTSGYLYFSTFDYGGIVSVTGGVTQIDSNTVKVTGDGTVTASYYCLIEGTQITLADGSTKAVENITCDDELLVWNFYDGKFDKAKPSWIKVAEVAPRYNLVKFSNGSEVGFVGAGGEKGYHRIFNKEAGAFTYTGNFKDTPNGTTTFAQDGTFPTVISQEVVEKEVKFYNVITDKHYNIFANGILTSCKLSNKYRIEDMKYVGEKLISDEQEKAYFERIESKRK
jgi:hypothetical protein